MSVQKGFDFLVGLAPLQPAAAYDLGRDRFEAVAAKRSDDPHPHRRDGFAVYCEASL